MKKVISLLTILLLLLSCENKRNEVTSVLVDDEEWDVQLGDSVQPKRDSPSQSSRGERYDGPSPASSVRHVDHSDNMRGFDPASEDDTHDNGMSRYMENYDDEGWD